MITTIEKIEAQIVELQKQIKELENQLKFAKQQEFLHSLKNYKWIASLTKDGKIFLFYYKNDDKYNPNLNYGYDLFIHSNDDLSIYIDNINRSFVYIFANTLLIYNMNMIISNHINDLLNFQKEYYLNIDFEKLKESCKYEICKIKKDLNKFEEIFDKLK